MSVIDELKELAKATIAESKEAIATMDEISEWNSLSEVFENVEKIQELFGLITGAISEAAEKLKDTASNEEKLDAAIQTVKDMVDLPMFVELAGGYVLKYAIIAAYEAYGKK